MTIERAACGALGRRGGFLIASPPVLALRVLAPFGAGDAERLEHAVDPAHSGKQVIEVVTKGKPTFAGIDPYNFYIDRDSDDNLVPVT